MVLRMYSVFRDHSCQGSRGQYQTQVVHMDYVPLDYVSGSSEDTIEIVLVVRMFEYRVNDGEFEVQQKYKNIQTKYVRNGEIDLK